MSLCFADELVEKGKKEGKKEGREEGREEGKKEGRALGVAGSIIRYLQKRFGAISKAMENRISSITDSGKLNELFDNVMDCRSLKEVSVLLKKR